jgi:hypothetical protein
LTESVIDLNNFEKADDERSSIEAEGCPGSVLRASTQMKKDVA